MQHHPSLLQCCIENVSNGNLTTNDWEFYSSTFTGQQRMVNYSLSVIIVLYAITCFIQASLLVSKGWQTAQCYHSTVCHNLFYSSIRFFTGQQRMVNYSHSVIIDGTAENSLQDKFSVRLKIQLLCHAGIINSSAT